MARRSAEDGSLISFFFGHLSTFHGSMKHLQVKSRASRCACRPPQANVLFDGGFKAAMMVMLDRGTMPCCCLILTPCGLILGQSWDVIWAKAQQTNRRDDRILLCMRAPSLPCSSPCACATASNLGRHSDGSVRLEASLQAGHLQALRTASHSCR